MLAPYHADLGIEQLGIGPVIGDLPASPPADIFVLRSTQLVVTYAACSFRPRMFFIFFLLQIGGYDT